MALISVIIPVYNVEKYLRQCLDSVINQTFKDLEIIIVNDGSTDKSYDICKEYVAQDSRIKLFSKKNGGLSSARNYGLDNVSSPYIMFVDSDDFMDMNMCEILYEKITTSGVDMISCSYYEYYGKNMIKDFVTTNEECIYDLTDKAERKYFSERLVTYHRYNISVWTKIYRREIFNNIRFPLVNYEDLWIFIRVFESINRIMYIPDKLYYYRRNRPDSIMYKYEHADKDYIDLMHMDSWILFCIEYRAFSPDNSLIDKIEYKILKNTLDRLSIADSNIYQDRIIFLRLRLRKLLKSSKLPLGKKVSIIIRTTPFLYKLNNIIIKYKLQKK